MRRDSAKRVPEASSPESILSRVMRPNGFRAPAAGARFAAPVTRPGMTGGEMAHRRTQCYLPPMASLFGTFILPVAAGAVAVVLVLGLVNMMRGGSPNTSQKLMRLRVLLQFVAIVIAMLAVWAMGR